MDSIDRGLGNFRVWVYNRRDFLVAMGILTLACSWLCLWMIFIPDVDKFPMWLNGLVIAMFMVSVIYGVFYCGCTYNGYRKASVDIQPRAFCIVKGNGKGFVLAVFVAVFVLLDATLKHQNKFWVILFCISFVLHLIHVMVVFGITEEFDIAGGFTQASFVMIYELTTTNWQVVPLVIATMVLMCYKSLLIEGVTRSEELSVSGETTRSE